MDFMPENQPDGSEWRTLINQISNFAAESDKEYPTENTDLQCKVYLSDKKEDCTTFSKIIKPGHPIIHYKCSLPPQQPTDDGVEQVHHCTLLTKEAWNKMKNTIDETTVNIVKNKRIADRYDNARDLLRQPETYDYTTLVKQLGQKGFDYDAIMANVIPAAVKRHRDPGNEETNMIANKEKLIGESARLEEQLKGQIAKLDAMKKEGETSNFKEELFDGRIKQLEQAVALTITARDNSQSALKNIEEELTKIKRAKIEAKQKEEEEKAKIAADKAEKQRKKEEEAAAKQKQREEDAAAKQAAQEAKMREKAEAAAAKQREKTEAAVAKQREKAEAAAAKQAAREAEEAKQKAKMAAKLDFTRIPLGLLSIPIGVTKNSNTPGEFAVYFREAFPPLG